MAGGKGAAEKVREWRWRLYLGVEEIEAKLVVGLQMAGVRWSAGDCSAELRLRAARSGGGVAGALEDEGEGECIRSERQDEGMSTVRRRGREVASTHRNDNVLRRTRSFGRGWSCRLRPPTAKVRCQKGAPGVCGVVERRWGRGEDGLTGICR